MKFLRERTLVLMHPWPPRSNSPDLNPIENLWSIITAHSAQVYAVEIKNIISLKRRVMKLWRELDPVILRALIEDMPKRMKECLDDNGGAIQR